MAVKSLKKIVHEKVTVKVYQHEKLIDVDEAKKLLGWRAENDPKEKEAFGDNYKFKDVDGTKVRCDNLETNRPFRRGLAMQYANEILRNKWRLNGESMTFDIRDNVQSGQHRLIGLVFAEQLRKKNPELWKEYGTRGPVSIPGVVVFGVSDEDDVIDTIDLGQKRTLGDVLFRNRSFEQVGEDDQKTLSNVLAGAVRVAWLCSGGQTVSSAPKLLHSVALDFVETHGNYGKGEDAPGLFEAVDFVVREDAGSEKRLRTYISLPYAAGLMLLMGTSATNTKEYDEKGTEAVDTSRWTKAEDFWKAVASGAGLDKGHPCLVLRNFLAKQDAASGGQRDEILAAVKLAWNAFVDGKTLDGVKDLKADTVKDKKTERISIVMPYMGGIDVKREMPAKPPKPPKETKRTDDGKGKGKGKGKGPKPLNPDAVKGPAPAPGPATTPETGKGKGKGKGRGNGKGSHPSVSYPFVVGDKVHIQPTGKHPTTNEAWPSYDATVKEIDDNGLVKVHYSADGTEADYVINPASGDEITKITA